MPYIRVACITVLQGPQPVASDAHALESSSLTTYVTPKDHMAYPSRSARPKSPI